MAIELIKAMVRGLGDNVATMWWDRHNNTLYVTIHNICGYNGIAVENFMRILYENCEEVYAYGIMSFGDFDVVVDDDNE